MRFSSSAARAAALLVMFGAASARAGEVVPTGQAITPRAARSAVFGALDPALPNAPGFRADEAIREGSREYVFVYDLSGASPARRQVLQVDNSFLGLPVSPDRRRLLVANHQNDSVSRADLASGAVRDLDLRPGDGADLAHDRARRLVPPAPCVD